MNKLLLVMLITVLTCGSPVLGCGDDEIEGIDIEPQPTAVEQPQPTFVTPQPTGVGTITTATPTAAPTPTPAQLIATLPCCNDDSPGCVDCLPAGFVNLGDWDPSGAWIQDIALDTVNTKESCSDDAGADGGKPFYQMRLGISDKTQANNMACVIEAMASNPVLQDIAEMYDREAWCSETIAYWHKEAEMPYDSGYRNGNWLYDWQLTNTSALRDYYKAEEIIGQIFNIPGIGMGRWVDWYDLEYSDFKPGITAPCPGAYVCLKCYVPLVEIDDIALPAYWESSGHSMMVDEMTVYRTSTGEVTSVYVTFLEGNSGNRVKDTREMDDIIDYSPWGSEYIDSSECDYGMKICGFGIDLDVLGNPDYDESRLNYVTAIEEFASSDLEPFTVEDREPSYVDSIVGYVKQTGPDGARVTSSSSTVSVTGIPDGDRNQWDFPKDDVRRQSQPLEITIDLLAEHPVPIKGIMLDWQGRSIPEGYDIMWAGENKRYVKALMPSLRDLGLPDDTGFKGSIPVTFGRSGQPVRYIKLIFPTGTFKDNTTLMNMRFIHDWGPDTDVNDIP